MSNKTTPPDLVALVQRLQAARATWKDYDHPQTVAQRIEWSGVLMMLLAWTPPQDAPSPRRFTGPGELERTGYIDRQPPRCEGGIMARWCPRCGDCSCARGKTGDDFDVDLSCPIHGDNSTHEAPQDAPAPPVTSDDGPRSAEDVLMMLGEAASRETGEPSREMAEEIWKLMQSSKFLLAVRAYDRGQTVRRLTAALPVTSDAMPPIEVGDWVRVKSGGPPSRIVDGFDLELWKVWSTSTALNGIIEIRGTRDGQPWHWTREEK